MLNVPKEKGLSTDESGCFQAKIMLLRKTGVSYGFGGRGKEAYFIFGGGGCLCFKLACTVLVGTRRS